MKSLYFLIILCVMISSCDKNNLEEEIYPVNLFQNFDNPNKLFDLGDYSEICSLTDSLPNFELGFHLDDGSRADYKVFLDEMQEEYYLVKVDIYQSVSEAENKFNERLAQAEHPDATNSDLSDIVDEAVLRQFSDNSSTGVALYVRRSNAITWVSSLEGFISNHHCTHSAHQIKLFTLELLENLEKL